MDDPSQFVSVDREDALLNISVIVPTFNRASLVARLLRSLDQAAKQFTGQSEIIIIDDSEPDEAARIQALCTEYAALYLAGPASVRQKRNLGVRQARYSVILFIDSDCEATPDLFNQHARSFAGANGRVAGVAGNTEFVGDSGWVWEVTQRTQFLNAFSFARRMQVAPWATCSNTAYRRDVFEEVGGFDTHLPFALGGEDVDLGLRLNNAGYQILCNPDAIVHHSRETWNNLKALWQRAFLWGRVDVHLYYRKHRERVSTGLPKFGIIFLLLLVVGCIQAALQGSLWMVGLPVLWAVCTLGIQATGSILVKGEKWRVWPYELVADLSGLMFEFGTLIEGIYRLEPTVLYKTVQRGPVLPTFVQQEWNVQMWSMWLGVVLTFLLAG
jgi:GT2 family glycosyltransferase